MLLRGIATGVVTAIIVVLLSPFVGFMVSPLF